MGVIILLVCIGGIIKIFYDVRVRDKKIKRTLNGKVLYKVEPGDIN